MIGKLFSRMAAMLLKQLDAGKTLPLRPLPLKVVYHTPCHMEKMGWSLYFIAQGKSTG
jgi:Fe-S oxidoreductase